LEQKAKEFKESGAEVYAKAQIAFSIAVKGESGIEDSGRGFGPTALSFQPK